MVMRLSDRARGVFSVAAAIFMLAFLVSPVTVSCRRFGEPRCAARWLALLVSLVTLTLCVPLYHGFEAGTAAFQLVERLPWIASFNALTR